MTHNTQKRYESILLVALKHLLSEAEFDSQSQEIIAMRLKLQYNIAIDPSAICGEIDDLIEMLKSEDRELIAA